MKKLILLSALFVAAAFLSCKHDDVEPVVVPEPQPLSIAFAEGNSLQFDAGETKTVHYTITGGNANNVVKAELQNPDGAYALSTTPTSATKGTIAITAKTPTDNRVIVSVSDGTQTIMAPIDVTVILKASFDGKTITVKTPGTLAKLLADYDETTITELTVIGNLNDKDIATLNNLPNLAILDMEHVNLKKLPSFAFYKKTSLTSVKLPLTLKTIGNRAFYGCSGLTGELVIPDSVTEIGDSAFYGCSGLTGELVIPDSVTEIGDGAFWHCSSLTSVTIPDSVTTIVVRAFIYCNGLTGELVIPDSVTEIGGEAFRGCSSLTSIMIPNSVTTIGYMAFYGCSSWTGALVIPDNVTSIEGYTFSDCSNLTSVTIPNGVTSIGQLAFESCRSLISIYCKAQTPPTIDRFAFSGVATSTPLYVPIGCADAYRAAEYWKNFTNINEIEF